MLAREVCGWRPGELSIRALEPSDFICWRSQNMPPMSRNAEALVEERLRTSLDAANLTESELAEAFTCSRATAAWNIRAITLVPLPGVERVLEGTSGSVGAWFGAYA